MGKEISCSGGRGPRWGVSWLWDEFQSDRFTSYRRTMILPQTNSTNSKPAMWIARFIMINFMLSGEFMRELINWRMNKLLILRLDDIIDSLLLRIAIKQIIGPLLRFVIRSRRSWVLTDSHQKILTMRLEQGILQQASTDRPQGLFIPSLQLPQVPLLSAA